MKPQLFVRALTPEERQRLQGGLRSKHSLTLRRCQILLASDQRRSPSQIADQVGCTAAAVRLIIHAFHREGFACLRPKSSRPHSAKPLLDPLHLPQLKNLLHTSPRLEGFPTSVWTLKLLAQVCHTKGWTARRLSRETLRQTLLRAHIRWRRAKHWITSPDPDYVRKKRTRDRLMALALGRPDWVVGFQDECWWSRLAQPTLNTWTERKPLALETRALAVTDPDPKALACYGVLRQDTGEMLVRFVAGRPVSQVTEDYLGWVCQHLAAEGKRVLVLIWDNASWHVSKRVQAWLKVHNRRVKKEGGVRVLVCGLPVKSPWLNAIEPKWVHGKQAIVEPTRTLSAQEVQERACAYYGCPLEPLLIQPKIEKKVA